MLEISGPATEVRKVVGTLRVPSVVETKTRSTVVNRAERHSPFVKYNDPPASGTYVACAKPAVAYTRFA